MITETLNHNLITMLIILSYHVDDIIKEYNLKEFYGEYNGNENTMFVNLNHSSYEVLDTYLHEARHAYQEKSVKKGEGYDEHSFNMIKAENVVDENGNLYNYIEDGVGYDTACCELDANNEAMRTMLSYSEEFGSDPEYLNYLEERKNLLYSDAKMTIRKIDDTSNSLNYILLYGKLDNG